MCSSVLNELKSYASYNDIWYHVSEYISPEDVQTFALLCRQTANLVNTRKFWKHLYKKYCQKTETKQWNFRLPEDLQLDSILRNDSKLLRYHVTQSLFYCYPPFIDRIKKGYSLDILHGRTYLGSWHKQFQCSWGMCLQLGNCTSKRQNSEQLPSSVPVNDWESLVDYSSPVMESVNPFEGVCLLIISCSRFIPFPMQLLYESKESQVHLLFARQMLTQDMRSSNLELDFEYTCSKLITTVKYPQIKYCRVLPWWHPDFKNFIQ